MLPLSLWETPLTSPSPFGRHHPLPPLPWETPSTSPSPLGEGRGEGQSSLQGNVPAIHLLILLDYRYFSIEKTCNDAYLTAVIARRPSRPTKQSMQLTTPSPWIAALALGVTYKNFAYLTKRPYK